MQKSLEKNCKNVILGHIALCIVVFQQISVYFWPAWCTKSEKQKKKKKKKKKKSSFDFSLKSFFPHFFFFFFVFLNRIFWKINTNYINSS